MMQNASLSVAASHVHRRTRAACIKAVREGLESLRAEPPQRLSDWSADHFVMAGESSHQKGNWQAWPFQVGLMDFMSDDAIEDVYLMKSKRVGYTKIITAFLAYNIAHRRRKQALWQPTDDDRDSYVKSEIDPVLDQIEAVQKAKKKGKSSEDTIKLKQYKDSALHLLGGKAARAFRRITVAVSILDEWSKFDARIEKTGDAKGLAKGRLEGAAHPKFVGGTTPLIKGIDQCEQAIENAEGFVRFQITCPHCNAEHPMMWGGKDKAHGFKWEKGHHATVRHVCPHCHESITQADYLRTYMGEKWTCGEWVCEKTGKRYGPDRVWRDDKNRPCRPPKTIGAHTWSAYSPQRSWPSICKEFEEAVIAYEKGDLGPLQLFVNETLGETWEVKGDRSDEHALQARAEAYDLGTVPAGGLVLTAGIDVQRNRWEVDVWAWGRGMESWLADTYVIEGNPASESDWDMLETHLQRRYTQAWHGGSMGLSAISIDSSDQTQAVYNWVTKAQHRLPVLSAIKGRGEENIPILGPTSMQDVDWKGQKRKQGIKLWNVGTDSAKDLLLGQLAIETPGPGYVHTSKQLPREWYEQLTAEQRIAARVQGKDTHRWVKRRPRNEKLDCRVYATHAAYRLGIQKFTGQRWDQLEQAVQPAADLFSLPQPAVVADAQPDKETSKTAATKAQSPVQPVKATKARPIGSTVASTTSRRPQPRIGW